MSIVTDFSLATLPFFDANVDFASAYTIGAGIAVKVVIAHADNIVMNLIYQGDLDGANGAAAIALELKELMNEIEELSKACLIDRGLTPVT